MTDDLGAMPATLDLDAQQPGSGNPPKAAINDLSVGYLAQLVAISQ